MLGRAPLSVASRGRPLSCGLRLNDPAGFAASGGELSVAVYRLEGDDGYGDGTLLWEEEVLPTPRVLAAHAASGATLGTLGIRTTQPEVGRFTFRLGDPGYVAAGVSSLREETSGLADYLLQWTVNGELVLQRARTITLAFMAKIPPLRVYLDKALKPYSELAAHPSFIGFSDGLLSEFLVGGLALLNDFPPGPYWSRVEAVGAMHESLLRDAALYYGIMSQQMFALDTDLQSWSDQGTSWVLDHFPKLAQMSQQIYAPLKERAQLVKMSLRRDLFIRTEISPSYRLAVMVQMAPQGALFRNVLQSTGR